MKKLVYIILFFAFCVCLAGCATTKNGFPDPIKSVQGWNTWIEENLW